MEPRSHVPPSTQIVEAVLDAVASGEMQVGHRLPSVRAAAVAALVNPNTVARAYRELQALGVVEGRNGSGVFVCDGGPAAAAALRRDATLRALQDAAREALRAGHDPGELLRLVCGTTERTREKR